jgi:hypothetical protein
MSQPEPDLKPLQDAIYREKVARAKRMSIGERISVGARLSDEAMDRMKIGFRMRYPEADAEEIDQILVREMTRLREWKERDLYKPVSETG